MGVDEVSRELEEMIDRYNTTLADGKLSMMNGVETHLTHVIRQFVMGGSVTAVYLMLLFLIFLRQAGIIDDIRFSRKQTPKA